MSNVLETLRKYKKLDKDDYRKFLIDDLSKDLSVLFMNTLLNDQEILLLKSKLQYKLVTYRRADVVVNGYKKEKLLLPEYDDSKYQGDKEAYLKDCEKLKQEFSKKQEQRKYMCPEGRLDWVGFYNFYKKNFDMVTTNQMIEIYNDPELKFVSAYDLYIRKCEKHMNNMISSFGINASKDTVKEMRGYIEAATKDRISYLISVEKANDIMQHVKDRFPGDVVRYNSIIQKKFVEFVDKIKVVDKGAFNFGKVDKNESGKIEEYYSDLTCITAPNELGRFENLSLKKTDIESCLKTELLYMLEKDINLIEEENKVVADKFVDSKGDAGKKF